MAVRLEQVEVQYAEPVLLRETGGYATGLSVTAMANAVGIIALATYLVCAAIAYTSIETLVGIGQLWFHGVAFTTTALVFNPVTFVVGGVTMTALGWILAAATSALYNVLRRR